MNYKKHFIVVRSGNEYIFELVKEYPHGALYQNQYGINEFFTPYQLGYRTEVKKVNVPRFNHLGLRL